LACLCLGLVGIGHGALLEPDSFEVRQIQDGWQASAVTAVVQTQDGYIWLGTYHGLVRFDGARYVVFDTGNAPGLQNGLITSLHESPDGMLWIGHETGHLTRFSSGRFRPVLPGRGWPGGAIEGITTDSDQDVWLLNNGGVLFRLRDGNMISIPGGATPTRKVALSHGHSGSPWVVANGKAATLDGGKLTPLEMPGGESEFCERVHPSRDGGLWMVVNSRLRKWRDGRWVQDLGPVVANQGWSTALLETRSGLLVAGTLRDGVFLFDAKGDQVQFDHSRGLSQNWVHALCEDHEGNLWIGTGAGLDGLRARRVGVVAAPDGWQGCAVLSFSFTADGALWVGTEGAGLYRFDGESWQNLGSGTGLGSQYVWSVLGIGDQLWVGTWGGGLHRRQEGRFEVPGELTSLSAPVVSLYQGRHGEIWIGTTTGLHRYETGKITWSAGKEKLTLPDVRAITESMDGTLWFGMSGGGLGRCRDGELQQFTKADGLASDFVLCLLAETDGTLWIGTADAGLVRLRQGKFTTLSTDQGVPSRIISHVVDDAAGYLWLGSHRGLLRVSKAELNRCADGQVPSVHCLGFGQAEGLSSELCAGGFQPGTCRTADGRLWFSTAKGLAVVDPASITTNSVVPPVRIEAIEVDGETISEDLWRPSEVRPSKATTLLSIPPGQRRFEFRYTGLSFMAPDKVRFKYRLEGLEETWRDAGIKRTAEYSFLQPGTYIFRVQACNNDGVWNENGAAVAFRVLPFVWQTLWFQSLLMIGGAMGVGGGVLWFTRRRVQQKLEQMERHRAVERERARIARDIHDDLGASLTRITMLSQSVRGEVNSLPNTAAEVDQIYDTARELTRAMDEIVWAVSPQHDTLDSLVTYLGRFAQSYLSATSLRCRLDLPLSLPSAALTSEVRHNVFLAFKEALNNIVKHAAATEVRLNLELEPDGFILTVNDNGRGFDPKQRSLGSDPAGPRVAAGNGLPNMRKRLEELGGRCEWDTAPGEGTRVRLVVPTQLRH
jgi:signal transduction histidine kinase/ligand-binding sensor domain-containing protein